ncbi:metal dependent phosphohydrolase [Poronia punctata]|nr:metal dependent phosphohydrolase [Poronia punctata]
MPISGIKFPNTPIIIAAFSFTKKHTSEAIYNHCVRSAYWSLILAKKLAPLADADVGLDMEVVVLACILHDMGWADDKEGVLLSSGYKRFEVDGADIARRWVEGYGGEEWDRGRVQRVWDAIAFHTSVSIAPFGSLEVATAHLGISADFAGPRFPSDPWADPSTTSDEVGAVITVEEFREVVRCFPYAGFGEQGVRDILCGLCREKPATTFDNFVGNFGREFGVDGRGEDREVYEGMWLRANATRNVTGGFEFLEGLLREE